MSWLANGVAVGLAATGLAHAAQTLTETRSVADFDTVVFAVPAEVSIEQGQREALVVESEPAVLRQITSEVHGRQLLVGVDGRVETRQPIRIKLGVRTLRQVESRAPAAISTGPLRSESLAMVLAGGGSMRIARLDASRLAIRINGAGDIDIGGGSVKAQQLAIAGMGSYSAPRLASESADVAIEGNGRVQLAASNTLAVRIGGIGNVRYHGDPAVTRSIRGIGSIEKD